MKFKTMKFINIKFTFERKCVKTHIIITVTVVVGVGVVVVVVSLTAAACSDDGEQANAPTVITNN